MIERMDDLARTIRIDRPAERIVCLVPSITETLFALGAGSRVVGLTDYCVHPEDQVRSRPKVGGTKNFFTHRVRDLRPDLVIANAEENRRHQVEKLEADGLTVFVTFPRSVGGCLKMIEDMAALTGTEETGRVIRTAIDQAREDARSRTPQPPLRVLCPIWKDPYMTVNHDTYVDSVIRESGGRNIFEDDPDRYPEFTLDAAAARLPEVVLLPTEPYHFTEDDKAGFGEMGPSVPAIRNGCVHVVEGELLSWYGPRLARALREISALLRLAPRGR